MKNLNLKKTIMFAVAFTLFAQNSFAQKFYLKLNGGYNFGSASFTGSNSTQVDAVYSFEKVQISFGKGVNIGGSAGYMFNKYIGAELGVNYLLGGTTTMTNKSSSSTSGSNSSRISNYSSTMFSVIPAIIITPGFEKINPYAKFGLIIGSGSMTIKSEDISTSFNATNTINSTMLWNGGYALGLNSAVGASYKVNEFLSVFGELNFTNLSYAPTKSEVTESKLNGVDQLPNMSTRDKKTEYSDSYTENNSVAPDANVASKSLSQNLPFSSVGLNVGIIYSF